MGAEDKGSCMKIYLSSKLFLFANLFVSVVII